MNNINKKKISLLMMALLMCSCSSMNKNNQTSNDPNKPKVPALKNAEVKTIWIPDKIEGNRYEEGHYMHLIDKQTTWSAE